MPKLKQHNVSDDISSSLHESEPGLKEDSSLFFEDKDEDEIVLLKFSRCRPLFLTKVGLLFSFYFAIWAAILTYILLFDKEARVYYTLFSMEKYLLVYVIIALSTKMIFGVFGSWMRHFSKLFLLFDVIVSAMCLLGIYYYFHGLIKTSYTYAGHYVVVAVANLFMSSFVFTFTTMVRDSDKIYSYWTGMAAMSLGNAACIFLFAKLSAVESMTTMRYFYIWLIFLVYNVYFSINSYFVVNYRTLRFYEHEYTFCMFSYWIDWFSFFWYNTTMSRINRIKVNLKDAIENEKREKELERERIKKWKREQAGEKASPRKNTVPKGRNTHQRDLGAVDDSVMVVRD